MATVLLSGFALALLLPLLQRVARGWTGVLVALASLASGALLSRSAAGVLAGEVLVERWAWVPQLGLWLSVRLDALALLFVWLITGVGALVALYAGHYLKGHPALGRFYLFLLLFESAMLGVVLSGNLLALFIFWELTSLSSYALIGFEHEREAARRSALQGLLVTAAGGQAMLAGLLLLGATAGSLEVEVLLGQRQALEAHPLTPWALGLIALGAFTKSAQLPFHTWLPGAMEAPTPVSAYLHSATMVKAGVYLLLRLSPVLGGLALWGTLLPWVGGATMVWGAMRALGQTDLKRLLAYATLSILGTLVLLVGLGTPDALHAALVLLLAHALYKGALFLVAGAVDHGTGTRDVRQLAGLRRTMPLTTASALLAAVAMAGLAPAMGFIAKELVYEAALHTSAGRLWVMGATLLAFSALTAVAAIVGVRPFFGAPQQLPHAPHEAPAAMWLGPLLLAGLGLAAGLLPGLVDPLLTAATQVAAPGKAPEPLALWHGVNAALGLSLLTLVAGAGLYLARSPLRRWQQALPLAGRPPGFGFARLLEGLQAVAAFQTRLLQSGSLRRYLMVTVLVTFGTLALVASFAPLPPLGGTFGMEMRFHELAVALLMMIAAVAAVLSSSRMGAVAAMGVVGFCVALTFLFFGAPDLALTQAIVEALTVVVFLLAFFHLPHYAHLSPRSTRLRDGLVALGAGGLMTTLVLISSRLHFAPPISHFYVAQSLPAAHGRNIVNVILTDFRALDTLGEITVLAVAGLGVHAILKLRPSPGADR
jgi:multicomponent Na+:H+ antiporter subunit A